MNPLTWNALDVDLEARLSSEAMRIRRLREWWAPDPIPQHVLAGSVVAEAIIAAYASRQEIELRNALSVLEEMAASEDPRMTEAAGVSVLERIRAEPDVCAGIRDRLGPHSRGLLDEQLRWMRDRG